MPGSFEYCHHHHAHHIVLCLIVLALDSHLLTAKLILPVYYVLFVSFDLTLSLLCLYPALKHHVVHHISKGEPIVVTVLTFM